MGNTTLPSGAYPIELRAGEVERLRLQNQAWTKDTNILLDEIGVNTGWRCLDLACGPGGITDVLAKKVGNSGHVVGLDGDREFLEIARDWGPKGVEYLHGDAYETGLPPASFDLVHIRFLASTAGNPEKLIAEALRLLKSGGTLAMQEASFDTLRCYPQDPAWDKLISIFTECFPGHTTEPIAQQLYRMLRSAGCEGVGYRPCILGVRAGDVWQDYLPATIESLRSTIIQKKLTSGKNLDELLKDCRRHLSNPDTTFTSITCVQVWGRK